MKKIFLKLLMKKKYKKEKIKYNEEENKFFKEKN